MTPCEKPLIGLVLTGPDVLNACWSLVGKFALLYVFVDLRHTFLLDCCCHSSCLLHRPV